MNTALDTNDSAKLATRAARVAEMLDVRRELTEAGVTFEARGGLVQAVGKRLDPYLMAKARAVKVGLIHMLRLENAASEVCKGFAGMLTAAALPWARRAGHRQTKRGMESLAVVVREAVAHQEGRLGKPMTGGGGVNVTVA